jgi:subtilisin family serine protease
MKYLHRIFSILLITGMMLGWTTSGSILAKSTDSVVPQIEPTAKFEALVLEELYEGNTDFFVTMTEQADLSHADQLKTKIEKGQYVFETLVATANQIQADLRAFLDKQGYKYESFYIVNAILVKAGSLELATAIAGRSDVAQISANHQYQLDEPMIDPKAENNPTGVESNITFVNADDVWAMGYTGQGTVVAGNDTGLYYQHPALVNQYRGNNGDGTFDHNYNWWDATGTYPNVPNDGHGHGTHTTGTMVGDDGGTNQIGMAPGALTVHCKNMTDGGSGNDTTFLTCFQWDLAPWDLSHNNANPALAPDAINNSWGYWGGGQAQFRTAINALQSAGIIVEVSAGNEGSSCQSLRSPGDYAEVFTTGSVNHAAAYPGTMTGFSSRGPSSLDGNYFPDFMAPGENIRSSIPGGGYEGGWSGTSMSGPHVTALIGLIWSANPALSGQVDTTYDIIQQTAVPVTSYVGSCGGNYVIGPNNDWGYGTIDAEAAVLLAVSYGGAGTLEGTVTDANTLLPVEGVTVQAVRQEGGSWSDTTDASGFYQMTVAAGTFDMTASHLFYTPEVANGVVVTEDGTTVQDFALTPLPVYTVSGYVKDSATNAPLVATVEFLDAPVDPVSTNPATGYYSIDVAEGTWTMKASAELHSPQEENVVVNGNKTQDFLLDPLPCILLVDDDQNGPDVRSYYTDAMDSLGYDYNVWDVATQFDPGEADLAGYMQVLWFNGYPYSGTFTPVNEAAVGAYLDAGGNFFFSSQDYLYEMGNTSFGQNYMHIASYSSDVGQTTVTGQNVYAGLGPYSLSYPFTNYSDTINPDAQAQVAFTGNYGNAAVSFNGADFNTVFFGYPFEALPLAGRTAVMQRTVEEMFGGCVPPAALSIDPYSAEDSGDPGMEVTYEYTVMNVGGLAQEVLLSVASEWPTSVELTELGIIEPGASAVATVTVTIPTDLGSISDTFTLTATGSEGSIAVATGKTSANVTPGVEVTTPADGSGWPHKLVSYEFTLTNTGDYTDSFALAVDGLWTAILPGGSDTGPLAAGAGVNVTVLVEVPESVSSGDFDVTTLKATSLLDESIWVTADVTTTTSYVNILPIVRK